MATKKTSTTTYLHHVKDASSGAVIRRLQKSDALRFRLVRQMSRLPIGTLSRSSTQTNTFEASVAERFYNDTFFSDQNACTSPRLIVWTGKNVDQASELFWSSLDTLVRSKYQIEEVQVVNKLTSACCFAAHHRSSITSQSENKIVRIAIPELTSDIMDYRDNSGYFYEYHCKDLEDIFVLCKDERLQTISYLGCLEDLRHLMSDYGLRGVDRIVPIGKTMDFDFFWDGYNLYDRLTRVIALS